MTHFAHVLALLVASCAAAPRAAPPAVGRPAPIAPPALESAPPQQQIENERAVRTAPAAALVRADLVLDECSNLGGIHVALTVVSVARGDASTLRTAHYGGHGFRPQATIAPGQLFVAALTPLAGGASVHNPGWCLDALPPHFDAEATGIIPVGDETQGDAELKRLVP